MPFKSSEIRWFSRDREILWNQYKKLPDKGEGISEGDRTDYYLKSGTINTGIKIREGNHELKVKSGEDEDLGYGVMQHWIKWSNSEVENILNTIDNEWLDDWIAVKKRRYKKRYEIFNQQELEVVEEEFVDEGCGAEFTEIHLLEPDVTLYTFGLEAFSAGDNEKKNLLLCLNTLEIETHELRDLDSFGYPELLNRLGGIQE